MIYKNLKAIFIHIPKTAGESVKYFLNENIDQLRFLEKATNKILNFLFLKKGNNKLKIYFPRHLSLNRHSTYLDYKKFLKEDINNYFTFTVVRNPYDLVASEYAFILKKGKFHPDYNTVKYLSFDEYIDFRISKQNLKLQKHYVVDENNKIIVDFICKYEELNKLENFLSEKFSIKNRQFNKINVSDKKNYMEFYSKASLEKVNKYFFDDFKVFGYKILESI